MPTGHPSMWMSQYGCVKWNITILSNTDTNWFMPLICRSNFIEKCHLGKQRHIGHSYKPPEPGRQYINQPPQLSHAGKEQPTWLNWWQVLPELGKEHCSLQMENSSALKHWNTDFHRFFTPKWSTESTAYAEHPAQQKPGNLWCRAAFQIQLRKTNLSWLQI